MLQELGHINGKKALELKGRVACEMNIHELVITELVFRNILSPLEPAEIASLLSCTVFQERRCSEPELTDTLKEVCEMLSDKQPSCGPLGLLQTAQTLSNLICKGRKLTLWLMFYFVIYLLVRVEGQYAFYLQWCVCVFLYVCETCFQSTVPFQVSPGVPLKDVSI